MVSIDEAKVDLFGPDLAEISQIDRLCNFVNCSEKNRINFSEKLDGVTEPLRKGIGLYLTGSYHQALDELENAEDGKHKFMFSARCCVQLGRYEEAEGYFDKAGKAGAEQLMVTLGKCDALRLVKKYEEALKELAGLKNFEKVSADYHCCRARILEGLGKYEEAGEDFETALEIDPEHQNALFYLAYSCDLRGDENAAMDYYKQITKKTPIKLNALLNLAVLYEDQARFEKSLRCVEAVLKSHPNHAKARLYKKDIRSSMVMIYDEEKEKRRDMQNQILEIPISDFELSVRSRNCLKKMNIHTLGDLLKITEAELLSYKNFGETSLNEIKRILETKGLGLGIAGEEGENAQNEDSEDMEDAEDESHSISVEDIDLSVRARRCLLRLGVRTLGDIVNKTEAELLGCKNFGMSSLTEIKEKLEEHDLELRKLD